MRLRTFFGPTLAVALFACSASPPEPTRRAPLGKPSAPVELSLVSRPLGGGDYLVTLTARTLRGVPALELMLDGQRRQLGAVTAGRARTMTARLHLAQGDGRDVAAGAATGIGNLRRSRGALVRVGAPAPAAKTLPVRVRTLSDGTEIAEVRP